MTDLIPEYPSDERMAALRKALEEHRPDLQLPPERIGRIKRILVNRHFISHNVRKPEEPALPVISLKVGGATHHGFHMEIHGPAVMMYQPTKPLSCGATVWIETNAAVTLYKNFENTEQEKFD
jgi:hypothetical protein